MNNYILLGACLLLGLFLRRSGRLPDNAAASLNGFVVHISLPALTLTYVHGLKLDTSLILPALMAWVMSFSASLAMGLTKINFTPRSAKSFSNAARVGA